MPWSERGGALAAAVLAALIVAGATANSFEYMRRSENHLEVGEFASAACQVSRIRHESGLLTWVKSQQYYPPGYVTWLSAPVSPGQRPSLVSLVMWSDLLVAAGALAVAAAVWRLSGSVLAVVLAMLLLHGGPLFNAHLKTLSLECGVVGATGVALWLLSGPRGLPSRRGAVALGLAGTAGLLFKWTIVLYLLGPLAVATVVWLRGGGALREALLRLALALTVAIALAGPWYALCLDWQLLHLTTGNDPTTPPGRHISTYGVRLLNYVDQLRIGSGFFLWPLLLGGLGIAALARPRGAGLMLAGSLAPFLALPLFQHAEARYLVPLLPALAAAAGLGLGSLAPRPATALTLLIAAGSIQQVWDATYYHFWHLCPRSSAGHQSVLDEQFRLLWPSKSGRLVFDKSASWRQRLGPAAGPLRLAVHPLNVHTGLDPQLMWFLANSECAGGTQQTLAGYDWTSYRQFLDDLEHDRIELLAIPEQLRTVPLDQPSAQAALAWDYVRQDGVRAPGGNAGPPADPFAIESIREKFHILERVSDPEGELWLCVNRKLWQRLGVKFMVEPVEPRPEWWGRTPAPR